MVKKYLFKNRDGQTPLPEELRKGLIPDHIQTMGDLDEYEEDNINQGLIWLDNYKGEHLTVSFWCKLHKQLFGKVWKWAGAIRKHQLRSPDFKEPHQIHECLKLLEQELQYWLEKKSFHRRELAARFHERLQTIHPFANGNGRWGRILTEYICEKEALEIPTWGARMKDTPRIRRDAYIKAIEHARREKQYAPLENFMYF